MHWQEGLSENGQINKQIHLLWLEYGQGHIEYMNIIEYNQGQWQRKKLKEVIQDRTVTNTWQQHAKVLKAAKINHWSARKKKLLKKIVKRDG